MLRRCFLVGASVLLFTAAGCGSKEYVKTVEVSGEVKVDGKAVDGVQVTFVSPKYNGIGTTDAAGKFKLNAAPGENKITFTKIVGAGANQEGIDAGMMQAAAAGGADPAAAAAAVAQGEQIPAKYTRYDTTDQVFNVPDAGANNANFDLKAQ